MSLSTTNLDALLDPIAQGGSRCWVSSGLSFPEESGSCLCQKKEVRGDVHAIVNQGADHSHDILLSALCFHSSNSLCCFLAGTHANFLASCVLPSMNIIFQVEPACCYHGCSPLQIWWDLSCSFSSFTSHVKHGGQCWNSQVLILSALSYVGNEGSREAGDLLRQGSIQFTVHIFLKWVLEP